MAGYFDVQIIILFNNDGCVGEITRQGKYSKQLSRDCCHRRTGLEILGGADHFADKWAWSCGRGHVGVAPKHANQRRKSGNF